LFTEVIETRKRVLGLQHPDTMSSMANLATTYSKQARWMEVEEQLIQVVEQTKTTLGLEHPLTVATIKNLASTFWNQRRWKEALELELQTTEGKMATLLLEGPDTLTVMQNTEELHISGGLSGPTASINTEDQK